MHADSMSFDQRGYSRRLQQLINHHQTDALENRWAIRDAVESEAFVTYPVDLIEWHSRMRCRFFL